MRSLLFVLAALTVVAQAQVPGKVVRVTLYRGQAQVTREVPLPAESGTQEVVVGSLPADIVPDSLFTDSVEGVEIRAVRYRTRAVAEEPKEEVRTLENQIREVQGAIVKNQSDTTLAQQRLRSMDQMEAFATQTGHADLAKGALDANALKELLMFGFEQRKLAQDDLVKLGQELLDLQGRAGLLERKLNELRTRGARTEREAVVFLEKRVNTPATIELTYLVNNCGWVPTYNLRGTEKTSSVEVEYNAIIQQTSGEDWNGVALTLSTATPAMSAAGPGLAPYRVALLQGPVAQGRAQTAAAYRDLSKKQSEANVEVQKAVRLDDNLASAWTANVVANDLQTLELITQQDVLEEVMREQRGADEPSLSYALTGPVSLSSRRDQQMVRITRTTLQGALYHVATPVLTSMVFREALVANTSDREFLRGPASVYLDGRFVGRAEMSTVARGESFLVGLGSDPRLRAGRELADRTEKTQGGNQLVDVSIRLSIENFDDQPAQVRLLDRIPQSENSTDLRVTLGKPSDPLSTDATYIRTEREKGILRWDLTVPASAAGEKARVVTYGYSLEYQKSYQISNPTGTGDLFRQEFERLMKERTVR